MIVFKVCILSNIVKHHSHVWSQVCLCPRNNEVGVRCGRKVHALVTANTGAMIREIKHIETKTTASQRKFISFPIAIEDNQDYNGGFGIWDRFDHIFCPSLAIVGSYVMISSEKHLWAIKRMPTFSAMGLVLIWRAPRTGYHPEELASVHFHL